MIPLGDKLTDMRAIYRNHAALGDEVWNRFNQKDPKEQHWDSQSIADCMPELSRFEPCREDVELIRKTFDR